VSAPAIDPAETIERIARSHDENFPVAFRFVAKDERADLRAIYAFCRITDDLGDEGAADPISRLAILDVWEGEVHKAFGGSPSDPRLQALQIAIERRGLDLEPFLGLIEANRMDQRRNRWDTFESLRGYCNHSATPVGRMVLQVFGYRDRWRTSMSDATCMGLQLINFWQDIHRDLHERGRIYLPQEDMKEFGVEESDLVAQRARPELRRLIAFEVGRARQLLEEGAPLARFVPRRVALDIRGFTAGGLAMCDAVAAQSYDTLRRRPAPGRLGRMRIAAGAAKHLVTSTR
jgi:squalene synthase HpnC